MQKQTPRKTYAFVGDGETVIPEMKKYEPLKEYNKTKKYYQQANDIYKRLKPYLTTARTNAAKTGSFNPDVLEKGLSEMQKIFEELGI